MNEHALSEAELKALISLLDDDDKEVYEHVEQKILSLGESIIPVLEKMWEDNSEPKLQERIEDTLQLLQFAILKDRLTLWYNTEQENLLKGLWIIATYQFPSLRYEAVFQTFEQLYYEVWVAFQNVEHPIDQIRRINTIFYEKLSFKANTNNFQAVNNSMINKVLELKTGNPISLCAVYMLLCQKLNLPVHGVNLPKLFILMFKGKNLEFYINVFDKGVIFSRAGISSYLKRLQIEKEGRFYTPCTNLDMMIRFVLNLINAFSYEGKQKKVMDMQEVLAILRKGV